MTGIKNAKCLVRVFTYKCNLSETVSQCWCITKLELECCNWAEISLKILCNWDLNRFLLFVFISHSLPYLEFFYCNSYWYDVRVHVAAWGKYFFRKDRILNEFYFSCIEWSRLKSLKNLKIICLGLRKWMGIPNM